MKTACHEQGPQGRVEWLHWTDGEMNRCNGTAAYERDGELAVKSHATPLACQASLIAELRFVRFNHSAC